MFFQRMKFASIGAGFFMAAMTAQATETRVQTLRGNGGVQDETLVFTYPGMIGRYRVALVELGTYANTQAYAAAFTDVGFMSVGAAVSRTNWLFTNGVTADSISLFDRYEYAMLTATTTTTGTTTTTTPAFLSAPARPIELLAGFNLGGAGTLGLRLSFADYKNKTSTQTGGVTDTTNKTAQQMELAIGFHTDSVGPLDIALTLDPTASQKNASTSNAVDSSTSVKGSSIMMLDARWLSTENASSPYVKAKILSRTFKATGTSGGRDFSAKFTDQVNTLEGGYVGMKDAKGPKLYTGLELVQSSSKGPSIAGTVPSYTSNDEVAKINATVVNGTLAGEFDAAWGFGLMGGMKYVMFGDITEKDNTTNTNSNKTYSFPETSDAALWNLGLYYKADALRFDASYGKDFLHKGPYLISGLPTDGALLTKISASYAF